MQFYQSNVPANWTSRWQAFNSSLGLYTIKMQLSHLLTTVKNGLCLGELISMKGGVLPLRFHTSRDLHNKGKLLFLEEKSHEETVRCFGFGNRRLTPARRLRSWCSCQTNGFARRDQTTGIHPGLYRPEL